MYKILDLRSGECIKDFHDKDLLFETKIYARIEIKKIIEYYSVLQEAYLETHNEIEEFYEIIEIVNV